MARFAADVAHISGQPASLASVRKEPLRWLVLLLAAPCLATGCARHAPDAISVAKRFTPEAVNALHPGMSEDEVVALLGRWDRRDDGTPDFRGLEYDALANNPAHGVLMLNVWLKNGRLWQTYLGTLTYDTPASPGRPARTWVDLRRPCACIDNSVHPVTGSEHECEARWASSCLALIVPPVKTCAADFPAHQGGDGTQAIEMTFDPVERQPSNAEQWTSLLESKFYGSWGRVRLAWRPRGWHVESACLKFGEEDNQARDLARRLPPRDMTQQVSDVLQQFAQSELPTSPGSGAPGDEASLASGTVRPISAQFSTDDLELLRERLNGRSFQSRLQAYTCGDPPPAIAFTVSIVAAAEYQEREVLIHEQPVPSATGRERCLSFGLGYELDQEMSAVDPGPPIDYHYRDPHTGRELPPNAGRTPVRPPVCDCSKRSSNEEWVTWPAPPSAGSKP